MKMKCLRTLCIIIGLLLLSSMAWAAEYKASIAKMPVYAESQDKGVLVDLTKAIAKASGNNITIQVVPFKRSMADAMAGTVSFHMPLIKNALIPADKLKFDYSTATIFHVNFVLYTNKKNPVDIKKIKEYKIETEGAHIGYFDFPALPSSNIVSSLKKVDAGRIDGFIFADTASDPLVKQNNLKGVKRQLYKVFEVKIVLPKGQQGGDVDKMLSAAIDKLKKSGEFQKIMDPIDQKYNDWQP